MNKYEIAVHWILSYILEHETDLIEIYDTEDTHVYNLNNAMPAALKMAMDTDVTQIIVPGRFSLVLIYGNEIDELIADAGYKQEYEGNMEALCQAFLQQFDPEYYDALSSHPRKQEPENRPNTGDHHQP